jgi:FMN phosphatase YigB (HAD superfamily)
MTSFFGSSISINKALLLNNLNIVPLLVVLLLLVQTAATVIHPHIFSTLSAQVVLPSDGKNTIEESSRVTTNSDSAAATRDSKQLVLVIDVDNTLYNEKEKGIERQIAQNIYKFCQQRLNYTKEYCDQLHHEYGSTVEGIRHNLLMRNQKHSFHNNGSNITNTADHIDEDVDAFLIETLQAFYQEVYDNVDVTPLLRFSHGRFPNNTGYLHDVDIDAKQSVFPLVQLLKLLPCPVYLASNSPRHHVLKVLSALGMRKCNFAGILTPDHRHHNRTTVYTSFPTKSSPHIFFDSLFTKHPLDQHRVILLDDSLYSLQMASQCGIDGILISHSNNNDAAHSGIFGVTLQQGLGYALQYNSNSLDDNSIGRNIITTSSFPSRDDQGNNQTYKFSDIKYLESKNYIDGLSINDEVWNRLIKEVSLLNISNEGELHVVDLGCGLLSMLQSLLDGLEAEIEAGTSKSKINNNNSDNTYIRSNNLQGLLLSTITSWVQGRRKKYDDAFVANKTKATSRPGFVDSIPSIKEIHYYAYEVNQNLLVPCQEKLRNMGFVQVQNTLSENNSNEYIFTGSVKSRKKETIAIRVYLRFRDFASDTVLHPIHLLIGCCFADLFESETLSKEILRFVSTRDKHIERNVLMYFPITYAGTTSFLPPSPIDGENNIPSDTIAFRLYSESLANRHGQCVDASRFVDELEKVGAELVAKRSSNWNIDPNRNSYLWETLLHFFEKCTLSELILHRWNATGWIDRARKLRPSMYVSNVDLLFRLQQSTVAYQNLSKSQDEARKNETVKEIIFTSRQKVEVVEKKWSLLNDDDVQLGPDFIERKFYCYSNTCLCFKKPIF